MIGLQSKPKTNDQAKKLYLNLKTIEGASTPKYFAA